MFHKLVSGVSKYWFTPFVIMIMFDVPAGDEPLALDTGTMGKGQNVDQWTKHWSIPDCTGLKCGFLK